MEEGMIFENFRKWIEKITYSEKKDDFYCKPIACCVICMTPYYGSILYWLIYGNNKIDWIITIFAAMGLNAILTKLFPEKEVQVELKEPEETEETVGELYEKAGYKPEENEQK